MVGRKRQSHNYRSFGFGSRVVAAGKQSFTLQMLDPLVPAHFALFLLFCHPYFLLDSSKTTKHSTTASPEGADMGCYKKRMKKDRVPQLAETVKEQARGRLQHTRIQLHRQNSLPRHPTVLALPLGNYLQSQRQETLPARFFPSLSQGLLLNK